jgi:hypothetical protein
MSTIAGTTNGAQLTTAERAALAGHEAVIEAGRKTFVAVGQALIAVREGKLYREQADTFDGYCSVRWGFTRRHATQLMEAADVVGEVSVESEKGEPLVPVPENERQARALADAPKGERAAVWREAVDTAPKGSDGKPKVTAKHVEKVVAKRKVPDPAPAPEPVKPAPAKVDPPRDEVGVVIEHADVADAFAGRDRFAELMNRLSAIGSDLAALAASPAGRYLSAQQVKADVKNVRDAVRFAVPHAVCPYCGGRKCDACKQAGWMGENVYKAVPADLKRKGAA